MIVNFVSNHADARSKLLDAKIYPNADSLKDGVGKFYVNGNLVAVYDEKLSMLFYEPKKGST